MPLLSKCYNIFRFTAKYTTLPRFMWCSIRYVEATAYPSVLLTACPSVLLTASQSAPFAQPINLFYTVGSSPNTTPVTPSHPVLQTSAPWSGCSW